MKKQLSLLFLSMLAIPGFLSATVVRLTEWERPNGTRVVVIGDHHIQTQKEVSQRKNLITYLKSQKNTYLCVEDARGLGGGAPDGFIQGLVSYANEQGIQSRNLEFRYLPLLLDKDSLSEEEKLHSLKELFMKHYSELIKQDMPFKNELEEIGNQLSGFYYTCIELQITIGNPLANFEFLYRIMSDELKKKNIYVCVGSAHAEFFARVFTQLNYTKKLDIGNFKDEIVNQYDDIFADIFMKEGLAQAVAKMSQDLEEHALDLKDALKQCGKE